MTATVEVTCDALNCTNSIDNNGASDDVKSLIEFHNWHDDPVSDEFHYCSSCWPEVKAEYEEAEVTCI